MPGVLGWTRWLVTAGWVTALVGCAGTGEVVLVDLHSVPAGAGAPIQNEDALRVTIEEFQDVRPNKERLGVRTHLWGGVTYFDVTDGKIGTAVTRTLAEFLAHKGWKVRSPGSGTGGADASPDVTLSGQIREFAVSVKSRAFSTKLAVALNMEIQGINVSDKSRTRVTVEGSRTETVFWFTEEDVQRLVSETLRENLEKMAADMRVENRTLRLK